MMKLGRRRRLLTIVAAVLLVALISLVVVMQVRARRNTYHLPTEQMDSWTSYGGVWALDQGVFSNNSDERGAKLMSGSPAWTNVALSADVRLDQSTGDIGLIIRSNDEDLGVDAYDGYYAGLRALEGTLIAGRSNYSWSEVSPVALPGGVHERVWYHLQLVMYGCSLGISAENLSTHQTAYLLLHEDKCVPSGRIGLRSLATGGQWRNVLAEQSTKAQLDAIADRAGDERNPQPLTTEAAYAKHFSHYEPIEPVAHGPDGQLRTPHMHLGDLAGLRRDAPPRVSVRGVVTLTEPDLYIEDSTGGAMIRHPQGPPVNVGEGVEISGEVHPLLYSAQLDQSSLRIISTGTPAPPLSVTPWQAASGAYDARFIEIEGHLTREVHSENGYQVLDLAEGGEVFRALYPDRYGQALHKLRVNSLLSVRGVCVLGKVYTQDLIPFLIFLRSSDHVQVLQGPPWWTPWHIAFLAFLSVLLACSIQLTYFRFRQWQKDAILRERERIAHDIHDTMAQSFAGIGYQIQGLRTSVIRNAGVSREEIADELTSTANLVRQCHADASHTIEMLSGASPDEAGDLLGMLAETTFKLSAGNIRVYREEQGTVRPLNLRIRAVLFHIGQEGISNAITHGQPTTITFTVRYEKRCATMMIVDDGRGFDATPEKEGFGILGMRRRAREIGGTLEVLSAPDVGTRVSVTFPLAPLDLAYRFTLPWLIHRRRPAYSIPEPE
jgi:signal transduction histidine kinase